MIVVDNASTDGTPQMLAADFPDVRVIANDRNVGFCKAGNQGAAIARGRHLLFLNDDTMMIDDAIGGAGGVGRRHRRGDDRQPAPQHRRHRSVLVGPQLHDAGGDDLRPQVGADAAVPRTRSGRGTTCCRTRSIGSEPYEVDWLSAAAMMVRRDVFDRVGGLAEDFYYFHEQVFCARVKRAGGTSLPASAVADHSSRRRRQRRAHAARAAAAHHRVPFGGPALVLSAPRTGPLASGALRGGGSFVFPGRLLVGLDALKPEAATASQLQAGRPEGGVAV